MRGDPSMHAPGWRIAQRWATRVLCYHTTMLRVGALRWVVVLVLSACAASAAESRQMRTMPARWAGLISHKQYDRLMSLVEADIRARKLTPTLTPDSTLKIKEEPLASSTFGLDNLVQKCRLAGEGKWPEIVREHFDDLIQSAREDARLGEKLQKVENALPLLAVRLYGEAAVPAEAKKALVWRTDIEGTLTVLMLDLPTSLRSVTKEQVKGWGLKDDELFERATKNTAQNVPTEIVRDALPGGAKLVALTGENLLVSSHVLLLKNHPEAVGKAGALVGLPTRHIVLCHPINDASANGAMEPLARMIVNLHRQGPGSTSDKLYWYREGKFVVVPTRPDPRGVNVEPSEELMKAIERLGGPERR